MTVMIDFDWALEQMSRWVRIKTDELDGVVPKISFADVDHSTLLRRLLKGDLPFKYPPPRSFSYPWYEVMDGKEHVVMEVWFDSKTDKQLVINQTRWNILRKNGLVYVIQCGRDPAEWKLWKRSDEDIALDKNAISGFNSWMLQRSEPAEQIEW